MAAHAIFPRVHPGKVLHFEHSTNVGVPPIDREAIRMRLEVAERILKYTAQIRQLQEMIPICSYCHKVRDTHDYWDKVESYIQKETGSRFSHGACPECYGKEIDRLHDATLQPKEALGRRE